MEWKFSKGVFLVLHGTVEKSKPYNDGNLEAILQCVLHLWLHLFFHSLLAIFQKEKSCHHMLQNPQPVNLAVELPW